MSSEVKEIIEDGKPEARIKRLPVPFSKKSREILADFQARYRVKYKRPITRADVAGRIFEILRKSNSIESIEI
jgi:hypothetical protein